MSRPLETFRSLARRPAFRATAVALPVLGFALGFLPLLEAPGYELGQVAALLAALALAPWLGIEAAVAERGRVRPSPAAAFGAAAAAAGLLVALFLAGAVARAALGPCRAFAAAAFLPVLAAPSVLLGAAIAVAATFAARGRRGRAAALYATIAIASLGWTLARAYLGPAAFALDPLLGYWPGPLYDEFLRVDARLLLSRAESIGLAVLAIAWTSALAAPAPAQPGGAPRALRAPILALTFATLALLALSLGRADGTGASPAAARAALARALGATREGASCTLHLPSEKAAAAADALLAECEFHVQDVSRALGLATPPRVTVFVYRSAREKRALVGAAGTDYTKPWLAEIHLTDAALPHPVLRHEVVHAVAATVARGPLGVPARGGLLVAMGLVEGLAVALEVPRSVWTVHEWSRAARDLGLLPDVARIVGPAGFWSQAPARAYTAAGSFIAWLLERHGPERVAEAYRTGDLAGALGRPIEELVAEWHAHLDGLAVPEGLRMTARAAFSRPSIFGRRCAREVATLEVDAARAAASGRTGEAVELYGMTAALSGSPRAVKAKGDVLAGAGRLEDAREAYRDALARAGEDRALRAAILAAEGDLAWREGDVAGARERWSEVLAAHPDRADARLLQAKLLAAGDAELGPAARAYLLGLGDPSIALARIARADHPLAAYLVARTMLSRGELAAAIPELARATAAGALPPALALEARLQLGAARCATGDRAAGESELRALRAAVRGPADRERLDAELRRCAFAAERSATR